MLAIVVFARYGLMPAFWSGLGWLGWRVARPGREEAHGARVDAFQELGYSPPSDPSKSLLTTNCLNGTLALSMAEC
jgi:hypothetical protein